MELFAATTGCQDPSVASFYLERADNDVSRAVNFYFDAPPEAAAAAVGAAPEAAEPGAVPAPTTTSISGSDCGTAPRARSLKRQRSEFAEGQQQQQQQQQLRPLGSRSSKDAGDIYTARQGVALGETFKYRAGFAAAAPSAEWSSIAESCVRQGAQFEDRSFLPVPSSLDGRAGGKGGSVVPAGRQNGGGAEGTGIQKGVDEPARCKCDVRAKVVTVSKAGKNQGRLFYGCVTRKCDFFRWADDDAPHTRQALSLVWRRFSPPRFRLATVAEGQADGGFKPQDIRQGAVGDCWFLAGLAVVSERPDLISRVVGGNGDLADTSGCFEVNLFKDGRWERVLVDNWLPCKDPGKLRGKEKGLDHLPAFAKASSNNKTWPCIIEKAFAKQHGSYDAISGGHVCDAFEALTGAPTETVMLDSHDSEGNWAKLLSFNQAGFPMGCATAWDPSSYCRGLRDVGLVSTHAYSVLEVRELPLGVRGARQPSIRDWAGLGSATAAAEQARRRDGEAAGQPLRLVRVRNPWGKREWTGDWSQESDKWSDSVRAELGWSEKNDGTFWMTWQDFMTRFELVDVCKARRGWAHASVATQSLPAPNTASSFRIRPPPAPATGGDGGGEGDLATGTSPTATAAEGARARPPAKTWAYVTAVQPTKRGRRDSYWYSALGLLVTEMKSGATAAPAATGAGGTGDGGDGGAKNNCNRGTLVAASVGGAKRSLSCEVFLESGKAYTASVVCLNGSHQRASSPLEGFRGFRVTVYSAHPVQVVPGERRPSAPGYFPIGPSLHQAVSNRLQEKTAPKEGGRGSGAEQNPLQIFALSTGAVLAVVPMGGSAVFFVLINTGLAGVGLRLSLTSLEGATASAPIRNQPATVSATVSAPSADRKNESMFVACPAASQKIALVLARSADHGSFRHEFSFRTLPSPPGATATPRPFPGRATGGGGSNASEPPLASGRRDCGAPAADDGGMFAAQALLPGAMGVVSRARGIRPAVVTGGLEAVEGYGGGIVTGGDGEVGSAFVVRRR
eukprot:g7736.t2